jgi:flagellar biosynthesis protein FlhF
MKVNRFVAPTSREALIQVREALGDDAVILSNRDTADGVEILASREALLNSSIDEIIANPIDNNPQTAKPSPKANSSDIELAKVMSEIRAMRGSLEAQLKIQSNQLYLENYLRLALVPTFVAIWSNTFPSI